jgi:hypothetical protein
MSIQLGGTVGSTPLYILDNATHTKVRTGDTAGVSASNTNHTSNAANLLRTPVTGMYSSIGLTSEGWPRIVYFDQTNQRPRLAYANSENPGGNDFKSIYVLADSDPNYKFSGKFSAIKVDASKNLHIVMIHTMGASQLVYVKLNWNGSGYTPGTGTVVDNTGSVGSWCEVYLDSKQNPWVSYIDMSRKDFYDGVKMAYLSPAQFPAASADLNGADNKGWEYMNVPARFAAKEARTGIGVYEGTGRFWKAAVGYLSDDYFRVAYYVPPTAASGPTP